MIGGIKSVNFLFHTHFSLAYEEWGQLTIIYFFVSTIIVGLALIFGRRAFCHYVCWMSPLMIIGTKIKNFIKLPSLRLKADKTKCISCKICTKNCQMSLDVEYMVKNDKMDQAECILCGACVDFCPKKVIKFGL